jgi:hypothetical protein
MTPVKIWLEHTRLLLANDKDDAFMVELTLTVERALRRSLPITVKWGTGLCTGLQWMYLLNHLVQQRIFCQIHVIPALQVDPIARTLPKVPPQTQGKLSRNRTSAMDNMADPHSGYAQILGQPIL